MSIELIYFEGCPNVGAARGNLRSALDMLGLAHEWTEWDLEAPEAPDRVRGYGSPTVLVNGLDVTGAAEGPAGLACSAAGAPQVESIRAALNAG